MINYIPLSEAAQKMGIQKDSLLEWLNNRPELRASFCIKEDNRTAPGRKRILIDESAVLIIMNMKDSFKGNGKNPSNSGFLQKGKEKIAKHVVETSQKNINMDVVLLQTAKILQNLEGRIRQLEEEKKEPEKPKLLPAKVETHDALRPLISMRINEYARTTRAEYRDLWNLLYHEFNKETGINLKEQAISRGIEPLDVAERDGLLLKLYSLASRLYKPQLLLS